MLAYRYVPGTTFLVEQDVPIPVPGEGEVLLRVEAVGLCHSDLHVLNGALSGTAAGDSPYTLGHEICGSVVGTHASVAGFTPGDRFALVGINPCHSCATCLAGRDNICIGDKFNFGMGRDGGFTEFVLAPAANLVAVPDGVTSAQASICTDAISTPYHAITSMAKVQAHENVVIIGLGGVGMNCFKVAKMHANQVFVSELKQEALDAASAAGATAALPATDLEALLSRPSAPRIDVVIDCVGVPATFQLAQRLAASGGRIVLLGLGSMRLEWNVVENALREVNLLMSMWGTKKDLGEVLELTAFSSSLTSEIDFEIGLLNPFNS
ncbi:hypothetical protein RQP46_010170 [Phenoliferia psychrophenolica]